MSAVTDALMDVSGVRRLCVSASSSAAFSCSFRRSASASLARSNAALELLIEPRDFLAARLRFARAPLRARGQLADDHRQDDERNELRPVAAIAERESGRRDEVPREASDGARPRRRRPVPCRTTAGHDEHEQQHLRGGRPVDRRAEQLEHGDGQRDRGHREDCTAAPGSTSDGTTRWRENWACRLWLGVLHGFGSSDDRLRRPL